MRRSRSPVNPYSGCVVSACCAGAPVAREQRNGAQSHALQTKGGCLTLRARRHRVFAAPSLASCKNRRHSHSVSWYLPSLVLAELATGSALDTEARMLVLVAVATADRAMLMPELTTSLTPGATSHARWNGLRGRTCGRPAARIGSCHMSSARALHGYHGSHSCPTANRNVCFPAPPLGFAGCACLLANGSS